MKVTSIEARSITIEGVTFTPDAKGVIIPDNKISKMKDNFFFKHYLSIGSFKIAEPIKQEVSFDGWETLTAEELSSKYNAGQMKEIGKLAELEGAEGMSKKDIIAALTEKAE